MEASGKEREEGRFMMDCVVILLRSKIWSVYRIGFRVAGCLQRSYVTQGVE